MAKLTYSFINFSRSNTFCNTLNLSLAIKQYRWLPNVINNSIHCLLKWPSFKVQPVHGFANLKQGLVMYEQSVCPKIFYPIVYFLFVYLL